jgi:hypothetical protein
MRRKPTRGTRNTSTAPAGWPGCRKPAGSETNSCVEASKGPDVDHVHGKGHNVLAPRDLPAVPAGAGIRPATMAALCSGWAGVCKGPGHALR